MREILERLWDLLVQLFYLGLVILWAISIGGFFT